MSDLITKATKLNLKDFKKLLDQLSESYYNNSKEEDKKENKEECDDKTFDKLVEMFENKFNEKYKKVGAKVPSNLPKIKLPYYMGSLDKVKTQHKLDLWIRNMKKLGTKSFVVSDKIDGVSMLYSNKNNETILAKRGDGVIGTNISHLIEYFDLPEIENCAIRGELVISKELFRKFKDEMITARNMVSGITNAKTLNKEMLKSCSFIAYQYLEDNREHGRPSIIENEKSEQLKLIEDLGFKTVKYENVKYLDIDICKNILEKRIKDSSYEIDGLVITADIETELLVGKNPKISIAFKQDDDGMITTVKEIEWKASKNGLLKPTVIMETVVIDDVKINRATAFNAKFIVDNNVGKGTIIEVIRSGKVIPYIKNVIQGTQPDLPDEEYEWNSTEVDIVLLDHSNNENVIKKLITDFFKQLDAKFLGEKTIEKLYNNGFDTLKKIFNITIDELLEIESIKQKSAERIKNAIDNSIENVSLCKIMSASNKFIGFGEKKIQLILDKYPNILEMYTEKSKELDEEEINKKLEKKILKIKGMKTMSLPFVQSLPNFILFLKEHPEIKVSKDDEIEIEFSNDNNEKSDKDSGKEKKDSVNNEDDKISKPLKITLNEQVIVFTGFRDKQLEEKIKKLKGKVVSAISGKTTMIVKKVKGKKEKEPSGKELKAMENGIEIIKYEDFIKKYID